jgi:hypothetical protein
MGGRAKPGAIGGRAKPGALAALQPAYDRLTSYRKTFTAPDGIAVTSYVKFRAGSWVKVKGVTRGGWSLTDLVEAVSYHYDAQENQITRSPTVGKATPGELRLSFKDLEAKYPDVREGMLDGMPCLVVVIPRPKRDQKGAYVFTFVNDTPPNQTWYDKKYGLVRQQVWLPHGSSKGHTEQSNYEMINAVPDSEFELPPGIKVVDWKPTPEEQKDLEKLYGKRFAKPLAEPSKPRGG